MIFSVKTGQHSCELFAKQMIHVKCLSSPIFLMLDLKHFLTKKVLVLYLPKFLCWGFTAQSTQWGHVERGQFT